MTTLPLAVTCGHCEREFVVTTVGEYLALRCPYRHRSSHKRVPGLVVINGAPYHLSPTEARLVAMLQATDGCVPVAALVTAFGDKKPKHPAIQLYVYINALRRKLGRDAIISHAGVGFRLARPSNKETHDTNVCCGEHQSNPVLSTPGATGCD